MPYLNKLCRLALVVFMALAIMPVITSNAFASDDFRIDEAKWNDEYGRLTVKGKGDRGKTVTVTNADTGEFIGDKYIRDDEWRVRKYMSTPPCRVRAEQSNGEVDEKDVRDAPSDCDDGGGTTTSTTTTAVATTTTTAIVTTSTIAATTTTGVVTTTTQSPPIDIGLDLPQTDFKIMMNYELGMHCTGFEFAYCCVLPVYNSILAQVIKPGGSGGHEDEDHSFPELLEGDPNEGKDGLGRETVLRDKELDGNGNFKKYVLRYWHDAQPRNDGLGKNQLSTLISNVEGNSLMAWNTVFDSAAVNTTPGALEGTLVTGSYNGSDGVVLGNGTLGEAADNYQNAIWNHLYFYDNLEGDNSTGTSDDKFKTRLGVNGHVVYPPNTGAALHPMGPANADPASGPSGGPFDNVLTFSGHKGTVVYTQMKVLENLPVMLTSPDIWEALGLPLTPFEDSIDFFGDPGQVDEDSVRPFVAMKAQLYEYDGVGNDVAVIGSTGDPVIGFGTAPIDIPNCERCHSNAPSTANSPNQDAEQWQMVQDEYNYWMSVYPGMQTGADWYARLKSAAISMLKGHDLEHGTSFTDCYPYAQGTPGCQDFPAGAEQNTRLGHESVICQRCHADNVIAVVKSATHGGDVIPPITEAIHNNHRSVSETTIEEVNGVDTVVPGPIAFADANGRDGGCQGCHPAHRSSGDMTGYPITLGGENFYATADNRDANGGCFVGRDVHSNPGKDEDGVETPEHLNAVGQWLSDNVYSDPNVNGDDKGIWCTNCHNQLGQEIWKVEDMDSLVHNQGTINPRAEPTLAAVATAVGVSEDQAKAWLDPNANDLHGTGLGDFTHAIWDRDPGLCQFLTDPTNPAHDGKVATVEVAIIDNPAAGHTCSTGASVGPIDCSADGGPVFNICGSFDENSDFSVSLVAGSINGEPQSPFCTTQACVDAAQLTLGNSAAVAVPFSAATDGRDHWLSAGEPHCADCHAAPYVEQSGNINAYPPFNYPQKASLMRYSRGHQDISCQGCHESIHGLYPVTPTIDTTTYAQAAMLNHDGSHGPLKCGTCHEVSGNGVPTMIQDGLLYNGQPIVDDYDATVSWMHTFTEEADPRDDYCLNCHGDNRGLISSTNRTWTEHAHKGRSSRSMMDTVEVLQQGHVGGGGPEDPTITVCTSCHGDRSRSLQRRGCTTKWKNHLIEGRVSEEAWKTMTADNVSGEPTGDNNDTYCGW